jgi:hypothetical protein
MYTSIEDLKERQNSKTLILYEKNQSLASILEARKMFKEEYDIQIYIVSNLDGIFIHSKPIL